MTIRGRPVSETDPLQNGLALDGVATREGLWPRAEKRQSNMYAILWSMAGIH